MSNHYQKITIRSWPKMIFAWPSALAALISGAVTYYQPGYANAMGFLFLSLLGINLVVLAFEFGRTTSLTFVFAVIALGIGMVLVNQKMGFFAPLQIWFEQRAVSASHEFYLFYAGIQVALFIAMFVGTRFDYWVLTPNELIHKRGIFGDVDRYSTSGLKLNKEINDVFEYLIGGAGQIVLALPGVAPIVLSNVLGINKIEAAAESLLEAQIVRFEQSPQF